MTPNSAARWFRRCNQVSSPVGAAFVDHLVERLNPLAGFLWIQVLGCYSCVFEHERGSLYKITFGRKLPQLRIVKRLTVEDFE